MRELCRYCKKPYAAHLRERWVHAFQGFATWNEIESGQAAAKDDRPKAPPSA